MVEYVTLCVDTVFGYASVSVDWIADHGFDWRALARDRGWDLHKGTCNITFLRNKKGSGLVFGDKPDKKAMREMIKQEKLKKNDE